MNIKRFMVQGKCVSNGETICGYFASGGCGEPVIETVNSFNQYEMAYYVDPDTIEPVAAEVVIKENGRIFCPNCNKRVCGMRGCNYCWNCGQRLDWSGVEEREDLR